jgi:hypothetical protein
VCAAELLLRGIGLGGGGTQCDGYAEESAAEHVDPHF